MVNEGQQLSTKRKIEATQYRTAAGCRSIVLKKILPESGLLSWVQTRSRLDDNHRGDMKYSFMFVRDITDRKKAEESLRESEEKYSDLAELLPLMIFELDTDFRITYANRHARTVFEFTDRDIEQGINALLFIEPP